MVGHTFLPDPSRASTITPFRLMVGFNPSIDMLVPLMDDGKTTERARESSVTTFGRSRRCPRG